MERVNYKVSDCTSASGGLCRFAEASGTTSTCKIARVVNMSNDLKKRKNDPTRMNASAIVVRTLEAFRADGISPHSIKTCPQNLIDHKKSWYGVLAQVLVDINKPENG